MESLFEVMYEVIYRDGSPLVCMCSSIQFSVFGCGCPRKDCILAKCCCCNAIHNTPLMPVDSRSRVNLDPNDSYSVYFVDGLLIKRYYG